MIDNTIPHPSTTFAGAMSQLVRSDSGSFRITGNPETILFLPGKSAFDKLPEWLQTNRYL
jgi:hypothetical protein